MKHVLIFLFAALCCMLSAKELKVLAIGNSFSEDAVEEHLSSLAQAEGLTVVIGNMYIGGCSLQRHANNIVGAKDLDFRPYKISRNWCGKDYFTECIFSNFDF